jgi:hypothetical protein
MKIDATKLNCIFNLCNPHPAQTKLIMLKGKFTMRFKTWECVSTTILKIPNIKTQKLLKHLWSTIALCDKPNAILIMNIIDCISNKTQITEDLTESCITKVNSTAHTLFTVHKDDKHVKTYDTYIIHSRWVSEKQVPKKFALPNFNINTPLEQTAFCIAMNSLFKQDQTTVQTHPRGLDARSVISEAFQFNLSNNSAIADIFPKREGNMLRYELAMKTEHHRISIREKRQKYPETSDEPCNAHQTPHQHKQPCFASKKTLRGSQKNDTTKDTQNTHE